MAKAIFITIFYLLINQSFIAAQNSGNKSLNSKTGISFASFGDNKPVNLKKQLEAPAIQAIIFIR